MDVFQKAFDYTVADELKARGLYPYFRAIETGNDTEVYINKKKMLMLGSNSYMGLTFNEITIKAAIEGVKKHGTGCAGSRFLNGTLDLHEDLELKLANFMNRESALLFSTGLLTNQGILSTLIGRNDIVYIDKSDHASIIDGVRLSFSKVIKFKHNDMDDLKKHLANSSSKAGKLIVVDGVFSMEGDLADLREIVELKNRYDSQLLIDEAHATGVMGLTGRGVAELLEVEREVDATVGTLSKGIGALGGFVAGPKVLIDTIRNSARAYVYTTGLPPAICAAALESLRIIQTEPQRRTKLLQLAEAFRGELVEAGLDTRDSASQIIPVVIGEAGDAVRISRG
ncbi:hypothetical protein LCGC14_2510730, partial [marine sediment metagenome]